MSKRRAIILSVVLEGNSQAETARIYGVTRGWVSKLVASYAEIGEAAFEPRSRRPKTSPNRISEPTVQAIIERRHWLSEQGLDAGPETIRWHLQQNGVDPVPSVSTIRRHLVAAGLIVPEPRKRPKSSYIRFEAELPNETWQSDVCHWRMADDSQVDILTWLDDHSRYAISVTVHDLINGRIIAESLTAAAKAHRFPASVLSDNALYYTTRFAGGRGGRNPLETLLATHRIEQKNSRPNHPTTCGKVERFQQTLKKWLRPKPRPDTTDQLQQLVDDFVDTYNHRRPHRSLGRTTPAIAYTRLPKATPTSDPNTHHRLRKDRIDTTGKITIRHAGQMFRIGIGRAHKHQPVIALIDDLDIRIIHAQTGELLRRLTLDPTRRYQPQNPNT